MDDSFRNQLQAALGAAYTIERELGGGGMSRVFVATETAIGRRVVVKTLPPELAARVNVHRFGREIQLAGQLQHPHIVAVLASGVADGTPYYTMPLVEGESLRARLAREGALPLADVVRYLRGILSALAHAHAHGVVHRDIKPDNVLLSGEFALVTDFGVAKALGQEGTTVAGATSVGIALGTPAYMAPEQAAADPNVDHRADLYAAGALTYEMLNGRPPFAGRPLQAMIAAQLTEQPVPIETLRPDVPPALAQLVGRMLAKAPADRPQRAEDGLKELDAFASTSGALPATERFVSIARAVVLYLSATVLVGAVAWAATMLIGLPLWVIPGALVVMALGAPVVAFTLAARYVRPGVPSAGGTPAGMIARMAAEIRRVVTWRRIAVGGAGALALFGLFVAAYMVLRALGIGPSASLLAAGTLSAKDRVIVVDFRAPPSDSTLGRVVSDAFRTDLEQSRAVSVVSADETAEALARMKHEAGAHVDLALAREIAVRDGYKAVVDGDVAIVGTTYIISARLVSAAKGDALAAFRETANGPNAVVPAIDRLSKQFRAKIGESLRSVNAAPPLERVTTRSLEALRKYTEAWHMQGFDRQRAVALFEEAVAIDTDFAMAWRKLSVIHWDSDPKRGRADLQHAMRVRDRLTPAERYFVIAEDYDARGQSDSAITAYEASLELQLFGPAWNNLAGEYSATRQWKRGEDFFGAHMPGRPGGDPGESQTISEFQFSQGRHEEAYRTLAAAERSEPRYWMLTGTRVQFLAAEGSYDSALMLAHRMIVERHSYADAYDWQWIYLNLFADLSRSVVMTLGRLREARRLGDSLTVGRLHLGEPDAKFDQELFEARVDLWYYGHANEAVARVAAAEARAGLDTLAPGRRRYLARAEFYARAGRADRAQALLTEWEVAAIPEDIQGWANYTRTIRGLIALARGRGASAVALLRRVPGQADDTPDDDIARAYELAGNTDSAIVLYQRAIADSTVGRINLDQWTLASDLKRLGEIYDARGNKEQALLYYGKFVALWRNADPELQPQVEKVKRRMTELSSREN